MNRYHRIEEVEVKDGRLRILVDGMTVEAPLSQLSKVLAEAAPQEQQQFEVTPSGYGIHWPLLDEDLSIDGLLGVLHRPRDDREAA